MQALTLDQLVETLKAANVERVAILRAERLYWMLMRDLTGRYVYDRGSDTVTLLGYPVIAVDELAEPALATIEVLGARVSVYAA